jgi:hypothetical protein
MRQRLLLILVLLFVVQGLKAQINATDEKAMAEDVECSVRFDRAKDFYAKMHGSPSATNYVKCKNDFYSKLPKGIKLEDPAALNCAENTLFWTKANIQKTGFANYEEAQLLWDKQVAAHTKLVDENTAFYNYLRETAKSCGQEQFRQLLHDLMQEYGTDFYM